jgi:glycosyltransferase involved in cell wall biosynthesis
MKLAAVMVVRDEAAVLAVNLEYHRSLGVDAFWVIDNGSADGTLDILAAQADKFGDVHWRSDPGPFHQSEATIALAVSAAEAGYDWILPIDADEFWWSRSRRFRDELADAEGIGAFVCGVDNFVQRRSVLEESRTALMTMTYLA